MRTRAVIASLCIASLFMMGQLPSSKVSSSDYYRLCIDIAGASIPDTTLRFPAKQLGNNTCIPAGFSPGVTTSIYWATVKLVAGGTGCNAAVYARDFPAGVDTVLCNPNIRSVTVGGCKIDSIKILANLNTAISVIVTDGTPATSN